jgi:intracellular multiplication protein IcmT
MALPSSNASWRDSARYPKFFFMDSRAVFPFFIFLLHIKMWTFIVAMFFTLFFSMLLKYGFTVAIFARWTRAVIAGPRKISKTFWG